MDGGRVGCGQCSLATGQVQEKGLEVVPYSAKKGPTTSPSTPTFPTRHSTTTATSTTTAKSRVEEASGRKEAEGKSREAHEQFLANVRAQVEGSQQQQTPQAGVRNV